MNKSNKPDTTANPDGAPMQSSGKLSRGEFVNGIEQPSAVGRTKEDWIGNQLKRVYQEAAVEAVPDDMLALLNQLDDNTDSESQS